MNDKQKNKRSTPREIPRVLEGYEWLIVGVLMAIAGCVLLIILIGVLVQAPEPQSLDELYDELGLQLTEAQFQHVLKVVDEASFCWERRSC